MTEDPGFASSRGPMTSTGLSTTNSNRLPSENATESTVHHVRPYLNEICYRESNRQLQNWQRLRQAHLVLNSVTNQIRWNACFCWQRYLDRHVQVKPIMVPTRPSQPHNRFAHTQCVIRDSVLLNATNDHHHNSTMLYSNNLY